MLQHAHPPFTCTSGSELTANTADAGGAIYVAAGCTLQINSTVHFSNNTAQPYAGGVIYLGFGAHLTVGR